MPDIYPSVVSRSYTASADTVFNLVSSDLWFEEINIHCYTNTAKYGDTRDLTNVFGLIYPNDVVTFRNVNLKDLYFMNNGAGANATISIVGVIMRDARKKELGIPLTMKV